MNKQTYKNLRHAARYLLHADPYSLNNPFDGADIYGDLMAVPGFKRVYELEAQEDTLVLHHQLRHDIIELVKSP